MGVGVMVGIGVIVGVGMVVLVKVAEGSGVDVKASVGDEVGEVVSVGAGVDVNIGEGTDVPVGEGTSCACETELIVGKAVYVDAGFDKPHDSEIHVIIAVKIRMFNLACFCMGYPF